MMDTNKLYNRLYLEKNLATGFTALFSYFEYVLKHKGYFIGDNKRVKPDWDTFAREHNEFFDPKKNKDIKKAVKYLTDNPPKKQIIKDGKLDWKVIPPGSVLLLDVLLSVRRVRNNLFHGGKFHSDPDTDPGRDSVLVRNCMIVLEECFTLNGTLSDYIFNE